MASIKRRLKHKALQANAQLPYIPRALRLVWKAAGKWTILWGFLLAAQGLLPAVSVHLTKKVVNLLVQTLGQGGGWDAFLAPLSFAALLLIVFILSEIFRSCTSLVRSIQSDLVQDHIQSLIHKQAIALDLSYFETPKYHDQLHRARNEAITRPTALLENLGTLGQNFITLVAMAGVLVSYAWWLPFFLFVNSLPAFFVLSYYTYKQHIWKLQNTSSERRASYYDWMLTLGSAAAEIRLFNLGEKFQNAFSKIKGRLRSERFSLAGRQSLAEGFAGITSICGASIVLAWIAWKAFCGKASLGDLALFMQVFNQGQQIFRTFLSSATDIFKNLLFLENLFELLALKPKISEPPSPCIEFSNLTKEIKLENVTFQYPGSSRLALRDFNLVIPARKITAIVGENGAGKSTLTKLLCRFYDPRDGVLSFDGTNIKEFGLAKLRAGITAIFQEPVRYHETVENNIAFGAVLENPSHSDIEAAALSSGADIPIARLPKGYQTLLGKWFGGTELSVGEWQKVALARAFLRKASLIILDEPTSAMDSWAEADWMARFRTLTAGKTAIIITHRFTTALQADLIHVMEQGKIVESGSHVELLALDGRYATSWKQQIRESAY